MLLNHEILGTGPPLIVLHGLFGSAGNWKRIANGLAASHQVIRADLRNHGRSNWDDDVSYVAMAADVIDLMDELNLSESLVMGHSMGGKVAMTLGLGHPARISALIVVDIAPVTYAHSHIDLIRTLSGVDLASIANRRDLDAALAPEIPDPGLRMFLSQNLVAGQGGYRWRINLDALAAGMAELTGFPDLSGRHYPGPTAFVYGGQSDYVLPAHRATIDTMFPAVELHKVDGAGHWLHAEQPDALLKITTEFLADAAVSG